MELIFLGTSSAVPSNCRNHPAVALKGFGEIFLFDCGEGTQRQMSMVKLSPMKINKIFITHFHGDHFLGLPGIIQSMGFRGRREPLHIFGPQKTLQIIQNICGLGYFSLPFDIHVHEMENKDNIILDEENYQVFCCKMDHSVPNFAYYVYEKRRPKFIREKAIKLGVTPGPDFGKLQQGIPVMIGDRIVNPEDVLGVERKGRKIVYSGDTRPCEKMIKFAEDATILIHESTFENKHIDRADETGHSTAQQAAEIAKKANVKRLILTHLSTRYKKTDILEEEAREIFEDSIIAEDFMKMEVKRNNSG